MTLWRCFDGDARAREILKVLLGRLLEVFLPMQVTVKSGAELL